MKINFLSLFSACSGFSFPQVADTAGSPDQAKDSTKPNRKRSSSEVENFNSLSFLYSSSASTQLSLQFELNLIKLKKATLNAPNTTKFILWTVKNMGPYSG